ncbi:RDD family protein [Parvibaculum sp.]|uniref:RDD family protein n=1 Tax=Parvibaculum sp. TaxID=2024848 RepID=UPI002B819EEC|nr:RDD family protein [Parvibaculum sp.]HUD52640.1 RDD family protein [Parvibaculum sp.]
MSDDNGLVSTSSIDISSHGWPKSAFDGVITARALAYIADLAVLMVIFLAAAIIFGILGVLTFGLLWPGAALSPLITLAYFTLSLGGPHSATPGMRWQGIELRTWDGRRPGYIQAAIQTILFYITVGVSWAIVLIVPFFNERRRGLHDFLCGTVVVRRGAI